MYEGNMRLPIDIYKFFRDFLVSFLAKICHALNGLILHGGLAPMHFPPIFHIVTIGSIWERGAS